MLKLYTAIQDDDVDNVGAQMKKAEVDEAQYATKRGQ